MRNILCGVRAKTSNLLNIEHVGKDIVNMSYMTGCEFAIKIWRKLSVFKRQMSRKSKHVNFKDFERKIFTIFTSPTSATKPPANFKFTPNVWLGEKVGPVNSCSQHCLSLSHINMDKFGILHTYLGKLRFS